MSKAPAFTIDEQIEALGLAIEVVDSLGKHVEGNGDATAPLRAALKTLHVMKECREPFLDIYAERKAILALYEAFPGAKITPHYTRICEALEEYANGLRDGGKLARQVRHEKMKMMDQLPDPETDREEEDAA